MASQFHFASFTLDAADRQLLRDGQRLELNSRYLDALLLLVGEPGKLVSKDRFMDEVWRGIPVTDEALTQCIKTLRRCLGDDAANPRFIETVPKHGYRFIAAVDGQAVPAATPAPAAPAPVAAPPAIHPALAGTIGAGAAGLIGGLFYGFASLGQGMGAASVVVVLLCCTMLVAIAGGAAVSLGIVATVRRTGGIDGWIILGGAAGGVVVGALVKLVGLDTFNLLIGQSPGNITGAREGALLGAAVGCGVLVANRSTASIRRRAFYAALPGAVAGAVIPLLGGRMFGGSLDLLARQFPASRLRIDGLGGLFGEAGFGPVSQAVTGALEGGLFAGCLTAGLLMAWRENPVPRHPRAGGDPASSSVRANDPGSPPARG